MSTYIFVQSLDKKHSEMGVLDELISAETHESAEELVCPLIKFNP